MITPKTIFNSLQYKNRSQITSLHPYTVLQECIKGKKIMDILKNCLFVFL